MRRFNSASIDRRSCLLAIGACSVGLAVAIGRPRITDRGYGADTYGTGGYGRGSAE